MQINGTDSITSTTDAGGNFYYIYTSPIFVLFPILDKQPYIEQSHRVKEKHLAKYPGYKYRPKPKPKKPKPQTQSLSASVGLPGIVGVSPQFITIPIDMAACK